MDWIQIAKEFGLLAAGLAASLSALAWLVLHVLREAKVREDRLTVIIANHQEHQLQIGEQQVAAQQRIIAELESMHGAHQYQRDEHNKQLEALTRLLERSDK